MHGPEEAINAKLLARPGSMADGAGQGGSTTRA
jgi:hypothetical protein